MRWKRRLAAAGVTAAILMSGAVGVGVLRWKVQTDWSAFAESAEYLPNDERGFYCIAGARIADGAPVSEASLTDFAADKEGMTLELLQLHIGAYAGGPISEEGLGQIRRVLEAYRDRDARLIVRVLYDWDGVGMEADPLSLNVVLTHMEQVGAVLQAFADRIYIVQGVFVGSWAEMHGSRYLLPESYRSLIEQMDRTMPATAFLAVRTPAYWRMAAGTREPLTAPPPENPTLAQRLSLFNDGMLGSDTDCGTYGTLPREEAALSDAWTREDELAFQNVLNRFVPNGGEVVLVLMNTQYV